MSMQAVGSIQIARQGGPEVMAWVEAQLPPPAPGEVLVRNTAIGVNFLDVMQRSELVLKKFGLLDRDFHLKPFLLGLLTEQIAGFYDSKTQVMNLLDWVPEDQQLPVMVHELTHALLEFL